MGAPKTQTVGGGSAAPVANSWNQFLQGQLYQQPGAQSVPQTAAGPLQGTGGLSPNGFIGGNGLQQFAQQMGIGNPMNQNPQPQQGAPGPFQNMLQGMMNPNYQGMISGNPFLQQAQDYNPMAQMPQLGMPQTGGLTPGKEGFGGMQGGPNLPGIASGYNPSSAATTNPMDFIGGFGSAAGLLQQFGINPQNIMNMGGGSSIPAFEKGQLKDYSTDPSFQAVQQIAERQKMNDVANLRARYGLQGNTASSGASLAEGQYLAEANPRMVAAYGDLGRQIQGLDLQQQQINNQAQSAYNSALGASGGNRDNTLSNIMQFITNIRGQDIGAASGLASQNLGNQQSANNLNANNFLQAMGMDANNMLNLFGQQSSNALNNQGMSNNWMQSILGAGMGLQGMGNQNQGNILNNLFNSFNQSNQIGNPQAQTVQTPSAFGQVLGAASTIAPFFMGPAGMGMGAMGMMGGGSPMAMPQFQNQLSNFSHPSLSPFGPPSGYYFSPFMIPQNRSNP